MNSRAGVRGRKAGVDPERLLEQGRRPLRARGRVKPHLVSPSQQKCVGVSIHHPALWRAGARRWRERRLHPPGYLLRDLRLHVREVGEAGNILAPQMTRASWPSMSSAVIFRRPSVSTTWPVTSVRTPRGSGGSYVQRVLEKRKLRRVRAIT